MEIKEYTEFKADEILQLYTQVGWTAYNVRQIQLVTDNTPKTVAFYKSLGFLDFAEFGCCGFMRG